jgi:hypothetical protein
LKRAIILACACLGASVFAVSIASAGQGPSNDHARSLAAKQCAAEKKADRAAFKATYGDHAMRNCIKGTTDDVAAELKNAAQQCKADRAADPELFQETWGSNENGRNALGKCVSATVHEAMDEAVEEFENAAQQCRADRAADPEVFQETWGSNHNGRNALGKCVSATVKENGEGGGEA